MKTFEKLKVFLRLLGILQYDGNHRRTLITITLNFILLGIYVVFSITTLYCLTFRAQTLSNFLDNTFFVLLALVNVLWYCNFIYRRNMYTALFIDLDQIILESEWNNIQLKIWLCKTEFFYVAGIKNPISNAIYQRTNNMIEIVAKYLYTVMMYMIAPVCNFPTIMNSISENMYKNNSHDMFQQIYPAS